MTAYVSIYDDTEGDHNLPATRTVVDIHRRLGIPASFGLHTKPLAEDKELARIYRELLCDPADNGLFEVVPHSHTHPVFLTHGTLGKCIDATQARSEIVDSKKIVEDIFERPVTGFRSPNGFYGGWKARPDLLEMVQEAGYVYISSFGMGPGDTVPAPLTQPYFWTDAGLPELLEIPAQDWHDNVLNGWPALAAAWPPCVPAGLPNKMPVTPLEKFEVYRPNLDWCIANQVDFYSPALHPFSIRRFEPAGTWVEMLLTHAVGIGMKPMTMSDFAAHWRAAQPNTCAPPNGATAELAASSR